MDNVYGWTATYTGLVRGNNYTVSGTVLNVGSGINQALSINPNPNFDGSTFDVFPGGMIDQDCLPLGGAALDCSITGPAEAPEPGEIFRVYLTYSRASGTAIDPAQFTVRALSQASPGPNAAGNPPAASPGFILALTALPGNNGFTTFAGVTAPATPGTLSIGFVVTAPGGVVLNNATCPVVFSGLPGFAQPIQTRPIVKVFGSDVWTGGAYDTDGVGACTAIGDSEIKTFGRNDISKGYIGSSVQYAATAVGAITGDYAGKGFYSSSSLTRGGALTFSNGGFNASTDWGGNIGSEATRCIPDFFDAGGKLTRKPGIATLPAGGLTSIPPTGIIQLPTLASGQYVISGDVRLDGGLIPNGRKVTIYVEGSATIVYNVTYSGNYTSPNDIPYLTIIARDNISIYNGPTAAAKVSVLTGLYIAGTSTTSGTIYTCTGSDGNPIVTASIPTYCNSKLTVYGAMIANRIAFMRMNGTMQSGVMADGNAPGSANTAEEFNFLPEMFIGTPNFRMQDGSINGQNVNTYDSVTALSPIF
jgi:hypothetical protein